MSIKTMISRQTLKVGTDPKNQPELRARLRALLEERLQAVRVELASLKADEARLEEYIQKLNA